jgi:DNA processing protein
MPRKSVHARNWRPPVTEGSGMGSSHDAARVLSGKDLPARISDLQEPPGRLYVHGELPRGPCVAIVGTRDCSEEGYDFTRNLAADFAAAGVAVLSGGARGIDTAAHEGALLGGGVTVVVAPAGLSHPYPPENAALFQRVVDSGGAYLSLHPQHVAADRGVFFPRNACLVALAHAVIITETRWRGGACNAAKWARDLGRPHFVVPHSPWHEAGSGAVRLMRLGARPLDRAQDVLKLLASAGLHGLPAPSQGLLPFEPEHKEGPGDEDPVLAAVRNGASHADEIAELTGLSLAAVQQRILTLALSGVLVPGPWGSLKLLTS